MGLRTVLRRLRLVAEPRPHLLLPLGDLLAAAVTLTRRRWRMTHEGAAVRHVALLTARNARDGPYRSRRGGGVLRPLVDAAEVISAAPVDIGAPLRVLLVHPMMLLRPVMRRGEAGSGERLPQSTLLVALWRREIPLLGTGTSALVIQLARRGLHARGPTEPRAVRRRRGLPREPRAALLLTLRRALPHHPEAARRSALVSRGGGAVAVVSLSSHLLQGAHQPLGTRAASPALGDAVGHRPFGHGLKRDRVAVSHATRLMCKMGAILHAPVQARIVGGQEFALRRLPFVQDVLHR